MLVAKEVVAKLHKAAEIDRTALLIGDQPKHRPGPPGNVPPLLIGRFGYGWHISSCCINHCLTSFDLSHTHFYSRLGPSASNHGSDQTDSRLFISVHDTRRVEARPGCGACRLTAEHSPITTPGKVHHFAWVAIRRPLCSPPVALSGSHFDAVVSVCVQRRRPNALNCFEARLTSGDACCKSKHSDEIPQHADMSAYPMRKHKPSSVSGSIIKVQRAASHAHFFGECRGPRPHPRPSAHQDTSVSLWRRLNMLSRAWPAACSPRTTKSHSSAVHVNEAQAPLRPSKASLSADGYRLPPSLSWLPSRIAL